MLSRVDCYDNLSKPAIPDSVPCPHSGSPIFELSVASMPPPSKSHLVVSNIHPMVTKLRDGIVKTKEILPFYLILYEPSCYAKAKGIP